MKTLPSKVAVCIFCGILLSVLVNAQAKYSLPLPELSQSYATFSGKIEGKIPDSLAIESIPLIVSNPLYYDNYKITVSKDQTFSMQIPISCIAFGVVNSPLYQGRIILSPGTTTTLDIKIDSIEGNTYTMSNSLGISSDNLMQLDMALMAILQDSPEIGGFQSYKLTLDTYYNYSVQYLDKQLEKIKDKNLPKKIEELLSIELKAFYLSNIFLDYEGRLYNNYRKNNQAEKSFDEFKQDTPNPDKSYYQKVFEYFDINNSYWLYSSYYNLMLKNLLSNKEINIPSIGNLTPAIWLSEVKNILGNSIGDNNSLFCQLLVAEAYINQMENSDNVILLSEKQEENIKNYYNDAVLQSVIFNKNKSMMKLVTQQAGESVINLTPTVAPDKIIDAIVAKQKGKTVLVDFWATWCGPCLKAMQEIDLMKKEFIEKGVVFVYITNTSSPKGLWREKIKDIEGEHYYLSKEEWNATLDKLGFKKIPSYLIFNKDGILKQKQEGYSGSEAMKNLIESAL